MRNILAEISPINKATGLPVTLRMSAHWADSSGVNVNGQVWLPLIKEGPKRSVKLFNEGVPQEIEISYGNISLIFHGDYANLDWSNYVWDGCLGRLWVGEMGAAFGSYTQIFEGSFGALRRDGNVGSIALLGPEASIDTNLLTSVYTGTGGAEGNAGLKGTLKPWASGSCQNIEPVLVDAIAWVYQVHGYGAVQAITTVYENALDLSIPPPIPEPEEPEEGEEPEPVIPFVPYAGDVPNYNALITLALEPGQWASCKAQGLFRLASEPSGKITADVEGARRGAAYPSSVSAIAQHMLSVAGVSAGKMNTASLNVFTGSSWSLFTRTQITVGDAVRSAYHQAGGYIFPSSTGVWMAGNWYADTAPGTLKEDRSTLPLVGRAAQLEVAPPYYRVKIGHTRCYSVHSANEISPVLNASIQAEIDAAAELAELARAQAAAAMARLDAIGSDGILERSEKALLGREVARLVAEFPGIQAMGESLGLTIEATAHQSTKDFLIDYLNALEPAWDDPSADTEIVKEEFSFAFLNYYTARQTLLNKAAVQGAVTGYLTNESHLIQATSAGVLTGDLAQAGGFFRVTSGREDVSASAVYTVAGEIGLDVTINPSTGRYDVVSMTADSGYATFRATYQNSTVDKFYVITKAKAGADGSTPKTVFVTSTFQQVALNGAGVPTPAVQTNTFEAIKGGSTNPVVWTVTDSTGSPRTPLSSYLTVNGLFAEQTVAQWQAARGSSPGVVVTATLTDGSTTVSDRISVTKAQGGADGTNGTNGSSPLVVLLTNQSHLVAADAAGNVLPGEFALAGGQVMVLEGSTDRTAQATYTVTNQSGVNLSINTAGAYTVNSMSALTGTATINASYGGFTRSVVYSVTKSLAGAGGANAKQIFLASTHQTFRYGPGAGLPNNQTTTFTATRQNTSVATTWRIFKADGTTEVTLNASYLTTSGDSATITHNQFDNFCDQQGTNGMTVVAQFTDGGTTFADKISLAQVADGLPGTNGTNGTNGQPGTPGTNGTNGTNGVNALSGILTNESHNVPCDAAGNPLTYANSDGHFKVYFGTTDVTASCSFGHGGGVGLTPAINSGGYYTISGLTADVGVVEFTATYAGITLVKRYTATKTRAGSAGSNGQPGAAAKVIFLASTTQQFSYNSAGASIGAASTTFTATRQNTGQGTTWQVSDGNGNNWGVGQHLSISGDTATMSEAQFNVARNGTQMVTVTAYFVDGGTYADRISVVRVQDGATGGTGPQGPGGPQGPTGPQGPGGGTGPAGRASMTFHQQPTPSGAMEGDTWYRPNERDLYRLTGGQWTRILGNIASQDYVFANQIFATDLSTINANIGTFTSSNGNGSMTITGPLISCRYPNGQLAVRFGLW